MKFYEVFGLQRDFNFFLDTTEDEIQIAGFNCKEVQVVEFKSTNQIMIGSVTNDGQYCFFFVNKKEFDEKHFIVLTDKEVNVIICDRKLIHTRIVTDESEGYLYSTYQNVQEEIEKLITRLNPAAPFVEQLEMSLYAEGIQAIEEVMNEEGTNFTRIDIYMEEIIAKNVSVENFYKIKSILDEHDATKGLYVEFMSKKGNPKAGPIDTDLLDSISRVSVIEQIDFKDVIIENTSISTFLRLKELISEEDFEDVDVRFYYIFN